MLASAASLRLSWSPPEAIARLGSPLLFAIRPWASVCLSLFAAFWLGLDRPYWAGGTAAKAHLPNDTPWTGIRTTGRNREHEMPLRDATADN
jgi:hypothetical protein